MKYLTLPVVLTLSACATVGSPRQHVTAALREHPAAATPGTISISGDELQRTGRPELSEALRAVSPIFH